MMYVATQDSGVYARQHQVPKKWERLSGTGLPDTVITYLAADPTDKDLVYAGTPIGIYKWSATNESWSQILADKDIRMIVADPTNGNILYAATPEGVYKTTNGGGSWVQKNTGITNTDVNVVVMPGVEIGRGCIIGANSVVTRSLPEFSVAVGAPAIVKSKRLA